MELLLLEQKGAAGAHACSKYGDEKGHFGAHPDTVQIDLILENTGPFRLHNKTRVFTLKAHDKSMIQVKCGEHTGDLQLPFRVLNAFSSPDGQVEISIPVITSGN